MSPITLDYFQDKTEWMGLFNLSKIQNLPVAK